MTGNKIPNSGPIVTGLGAAFIAAERTNNGWVKQQELKLKKNSQMIETRKIQTQHEIANQTHAIQNSIQKQQIFESLNKKQITEPQAEQLFRDLNKNAFLKKKPIEKNIQNFELLQPPFTTISFTSQPNLKISEKKNKICSQQSDDSNLKLLELDDYPLGQIIFFSISAALIGSFLVYPLVIGIIKKIQYRLNKKS